MIPMNLKCSDDEFKDFILGTYIERYTAGRARAMRLINIAAVISEGKTKKHEELKQKCIMLASNEIRSHCEDVNVYKSLIKIKDEADSKSVIERMEREQRVRKQELDIALNKAKSDRDHELLTKTNKGLGDYFYSIGDANQAIKFYSQWKDNITAPPLHLDSSKLTLQANLKLVEASLLQKSLTVQLRHHVAIAQHLSKSEDATVSSALEGCLGLSTLSEDFKASVKHFLGVRNTFPSWMDSFLTLHDVAVYTTLLAIASLSRKDLKMMLIENEEFMGVLDRVPCTRELLLDFYHLQLATFVDKLETIRSFLCMDLHLGCVIDELVQGCRLHAMRMLTSPYSTVSFASIASSLNSNANAIQIEIYKHVLNGRLRGRVDGKDGVFVNDEKLEARKEEVFKKVSSVGRAFTKETEAMLLRLSMLESMCVYSEKEEEEMDKL